LGVHNAIWIAPDLTPANIVAKKGPGLWEVEDIPDCGVHFEGVILAEASLRTFVIVYGLEKAKGPFVTTDVKCTQNREIKCPPS